MLTAERDQVPHIQSTLATAPFHYRPQQLPTLRESDGVELTARVELGRGDLGQVTQLLADNVNLLIGASEESGASADEMVSSRCPAAARRVDSLVAGAILANLHNVNEDALESRTSLDILFELHESRSVEAVAKAVPDNYGDGYGFERNDRRAEGQSRRREQGELERREEHVGLLGWLEGGMLWSAL